MHVDRVGRVAPHRLEQVERAHGVDVEILERTARRQIVAGLRRRVHHEMRTHPLETLQEPVAVADVEFDVLERRVRR